MSKLYDFLKQSRVTNLYTIHKERGPRQSVYSLTEPILPPEQPIHSLFATYTKKKLTPDQEFSREMMKNDSRSLTLDQAFSENMMKDKRKPDAKGSWPDL